MSLSLYFSSRSLNYLTFARLLIYCCLLQQKCNLSGGRDMVSCTRSTACHIIGILRYITKHTVGTQLIVLN